MKKSILRYYLLPALLALTVLSCKEEAIVTPVNTDNFDREAMLINWADNIIIPAYQHYQRKLAGLVDAKDAFVNAPDAAGLTELRSRWLEAYRAWQQVSMFEIGKAEEISLRNYTNIYPTNTEEITANLTAGDYNLSLPSNYDAQGFPALDYLLYGDGLSDEAALERLSGPSYVQYVSDLVDRLYELTTEVVTDWEAGYRDVFVSNSGSSATSSVDKLVNDFLFYYEKFLRAGKVGIPAGVFSGSPNSMSVEAPYSGQFSRELLQISLDAVQDFFNGNSFDGRSAGACLRTYLNYLDGIVDREDLAGRINAQWEAAKQQIATLQPDLRQQVQSDNTEMLATFDELQKAVILLKVDMLQALNVRVDFVDADGD